MSEKFNTFFLAQCRDSQFFIPHIIVTINYQLIVIILRLIMMMMMIKGKNENHNYEK